MSCDEIVEFLLEGDSSVQKELDAHLVDCQRCRSLQEILSPLRSFSENEQTAASLPFSTSQPASSDAILIASESANRLKKQVTKLRTQRKRTFSTLKYAAAFLAGVAASLGGIAVLRSEPIQPANAQTTVCLWETEFDQHQQESDFVRSCVACHLVTN